MATDKVVTPPFRVSFPSVFEPSSFENSAPKYSTVMIFHPKDFDKKAKAQFKAMEALLDDVSKEKFKKAVKDLPDNFKRAFRDGNEKEHLEGYGDGTVFATCSSHQRPGLVDRDKTPILAEEDFYPGCWARATVTAYAYDNRGKGVAFGLHNIQKLGEGQNFTGRVPADEDFDDDADEVWEDESAPDLEEGDPLG